MNENILSVKNLNLRVKDDDSETGSKEILYVQDFNIKKGDCVFILGNNAAGKSTFIKTLFSLNKEDSKYIIEDKDLSEDEPYEAILNDLKISDDDVDDDRFTESVITIPQDDTFLGHDSVWKALRSPTEAAIYELGFDKAKRAEKLKELDELCKEYTKNYLKALYLRDKKLKKKNFKSEEDAINKCISILKSKKASQCSGGQKKLISILSCIIRARIIDVKLIVMDEPMNHLDFENKRNIAELIRDLHEIKDEDGTNKFSFLIISHCLVFDFIEKDEHCLQYKIDNCKLIKLRKKIYHDCLFSDDEFKHC